MLDKKMIAMLMTLSMLAASLAGCLGGDDEDPVDDWELMPAADITADIVTSAWDPIIPNLNDGEMCDAIISAMTKTDERDQVVDFTRGYYTSSQGVIGAAGSASISDVSDLNVAGTTIAVQSGTTSDLYAQDNLAMATIVAYDDFPSVTAAVSNGEADYAMGDSPVLALSGDLMTTFSDETFGIAVREDSGELLDALNVAITAIVDSGEYDAIFGAWFEGSVVLTDDRDENTAVAYPASPSEGSTLTSVLESGSLRFCSDTAYPPFENLDENGNAVGFDVDIANALVDEIAAFYMGTDNPMFVAPVTATTIKLGFLNDATGPISQFAAPFTFAWEAAVADLNAMGDDYVFEVIEADSGCNGETATAAAQSLADAGVVAVAGAACSGASMGANTVLSAAGIPMISYASTSPALSDATAYPHFYRIVPSDALQGEAVADMIMASGAMNTAIVHMTNDYGAGLADSVATNLGSDHVCTQLGYDQETTTDFQSAVQAVMEAGCDSVFLGSYSADGADIVETMAVMGAAIPIFSADGMAGEASLNDYTNPAVANGIQVTKPAAASASTTTFTDACAADSVCSGGIYQSEAYDAVMMLGHAAMMEDGANMGTHVPMVGSGDGYDGETGTHVFLENGDVGGSGYDVCTFHHVPTYGDYFNCDKMWSVTSDGVVDAPWMGATVKIGFLNDATGPIAVYADGFVAASQIALGLVNTVGFSSGVQFEIVYADSGCNGEMGTSAAQSLVDAGVWGVVGAACSGASMGANSVLAAAGVPQISYASTSPALSDATAYPGFFRVVPSDAEQGQAMAAIATADGMDNIAVVHMTNDYGAGLADAFVSNMNASHICTQLGYDVETTTDFASAVEAVSNAGCTSVFLVSYAADGAMILEEMATQGVNIPVYGGDGIAEEGLAAGMADASIVDGVIASKPSSGGSMSEVQMVFASLCGAHPDCAGGIYTAEAFDAITMMALSAFTYLSTPGLDAGMAVMAVGQGWDGASGTLSFMANGDVPSSGFCIGEFSHDSADGSVSYDCVRQWDIINGITTNSA
jgi:branched-chain amino acid transport system substrate-binding protein